MFFKIQYSTFRHFFILLNILFDLFRMNYCTLPQASQEDLLHSFKSYSDVTMFHYTVPKDVFRATWHFAAFMDDPTCQPRKVYIHLKVGSYPIITLNNGIFPTSAYTKQDDSIVITTTTTYQQKNATILPVYGPQSGDWFVAAYMSYWDERVQQQGLGHKCRYSIGTVALWSQVDNIENISVGYQMTFQTSTTTTYYKIYIPSGVWSFRLSVWNCNFLLHNIQDIREPCIETMSLKGRALPILNHLYRKESKYLTTNASYTFTELSPYEDSYYYLLVISKSVIEFNVKVDILECPVRLTDTSFTRKYIGTFLNFNSVTGSNTKDVLKYKWSYKENNVSRFYNRNKLYQKNEEYEIDNECMPRYQLVRVKHAETFSIVYLLQRKEWLSSQLILSDATPTIMQFDILPLIDIGGTLDIDIHSEVEKLPSIQHQSALITICIQRDRIPKLGNLHSCQSETLSMNLSSLNKHNTNFSIVYPQPGTWYIISHMICYNWNGKSVHCQYGEISMIMNVRIRKCIFSDQKPCGNHGICQEIQKNVLHYATCNCFKGYTGWDCTDISNTITAISSFMSAMLLILSNAFFIPAIYIAIKRKLYAEGLVYLATMLFSSLYHACDQNGGQFCIVKYEVLQYNDFFSSILAFWVTLVAMAKLPIDCIPLCHMIGVFIITFSIQIDKMSLINILVPLSMGIIIPIFTCIYRIVKSKKCNKPSLKILLGLFLAFAGLLLYSFIETEENYQYVHSVWHIVMAISLIFLLPTRSKQTISLKNTFFNNDGESSWCYKESHEIPTFTLIDQEIQTIVSN
ncbi:post-GPI attachment to proteins factor 6 isoform X1 [Camponotus floridanus]|uniref:post-GPI attachment to proteins factor 6 isoform X1 n=2 Tax=Camponotus floridanus TaxID=104421 RepID=UPI000DC6CCD1|nr:post-GPI attachment to proteins factor 6 isoform X1 [Camponotus floridanus]